MPGPARPGGPRPRRCSPPLMWWPGGRMPRPALTVPLRTGSERACSTGSGSPVRADSSSTAASDSTSPSTGSTSPGRTRRRSPGRTSVQLAVRPTPRPCSGAPSRGARSTSDRRSRSARAEARASSIRPLASITVMIAPARNSPTASVPTWARTAMTSTPSWWRRADCSTHHMPGMHPERGRGRPHRVSRLCLACHGQGTAHGEGDERDGEQDRLAPSASLFGHRSGRHGRSRR